MAKTIDHMEFYVAVKPYTTEGNGDRVFDTLSMSVSYTKGKGFRANYHPGWSTGWGGFGCVFDFGSNPLTGTTWVDIEAAAKNNVKRLTQFKTNLEAAKDDIVWLFDERKWDELKRLVKDVAICGYTPGIEQRMKDMKNPQGNSSDKAVKYRPATMAEIEGRDTDLYMDGEQVWVMMIHRSETIGEGEPKLDYIMLTNMKKVQVEDLQVIDDAPEESPMMKQYRELKEKHPDAMLLFRCGDFYETYEDDAAEAAKVLGITLTKSTTTGVRMAGFPHHALDTYLPKLIRAGKRVAICDQLEDPKLTKKLVKRGITELVSPATNNDNNNNQTSEDKTMATKKNNNESVNVQNNAQVNNNEIDVNVGEVTLDSICPVMQPVEGSEPVEEKPAVTVPLGDHGTLVIGGVPKPKKSEDKPKVTLKRKVQDSVPQTESTLPRVTLVVYTTKRGEQAPRIEGFGGENDPRWKSHADERERLKALKADADKKNEKLRKQMKGKTRAEKDELMKKWVRVPNDPFNAVIDKDRTTGDKRYIFLMGAKYMQVARELVDAYNSGDETAIAAAEQAVIDCKNGIVKDIEAQRDAKRAEREAAKAQTAAPAGEQQGAPAMSAEDAAMFDLFKKFMAGDKEAMAKVGAALKAA